MKGSASDPSDAALSLFATSQRLGVQPTQKLFHALLIILAYNGRKTETLNVLSLMKEKSHDKRATVTAYGLAVRACCIACDGPAGEVVLKEMLESTQHKSVLTLDAFHTLMTFYVRTQPDRERALAVYDTMVAAGVRPNHQTYEFLLLAYGSIGDKPDFESMEDVWRKLVDDENVAVRTSHWVALVHSYGFVGRDLERARNAFDSFITYSGDVPPNALLYDTILRSCRVAEREDLFDEYVSKMGGSGVVVAASFKNTLIKAYATWGRLDAARDVFESIPDPPTTSSDASTPSPKKELQGHAHYRAISNWDAMIQSEVEAGEVDFLERMKRRIDAAELGSSSPRRKGVDGA
ncbi:hypothetical protein RQP46_003645 [Phenoliferia psychrophenolica]